MSTRAWYCQKCALKINELNGEPVCVSSCGLCELCYGPIIYFVDLCQIQDGNDVITLDQRCWATLGKPLTAEKYRAAAEAYHAGKTHSEGGTASDWDHRIVTAVSYALGGMIGQTDDVDRLTQQIVRGDSTDKMRTAVGIAVAFIRWSQDLKRKREHYASEVLRLQKVVCEMTEKITALEKGKK
jgi:hypothetical protein